MLTQQAANTSSEIEVDDDAASDDIAPEEVALSEASQPMELHEVEPERMPDALVEELLSSPIAEVEEPEPENLGFILSQSQRSDEALNRLSQELESNPEDPDLKLAIGIALQRTGDFATSLDILSELLEVSPSNLEARRFYANALMHLDRWSEGLLELEKSRGELTPLQSDFCEDISRLWTGQDITDKHLVIVSNGRQSDQILFSRYLNELRKFRPHKIGFVGDSEMVTLLRSLRDVNRVDSALFEPFDYFIPVESLPLRLGADPTNIPTEPYLHCNERKVDVLKAKAKGAKPLLGLCWRDHQPEGASEDDVDYRASANSLELELLEWYLKELSMDYDLVSLQQELRVDERDVLNRCDCQIIEPEQFSDFENIAEWVSCLDRLITVESPIAHLAGALGVEADVILPYIPDWKWGIKGNVSTWYPQLKIHSKGSEDNWNDCVAKVLDGIKISSSSSMAKAS